MKTLVTIKCRGCGWTEIIEPHQTLEAGTLSMGAVHIDGHRLMCNLCSGTIYDVVNVNVTS